MLLSPGSDGGFVQWVVIYFDVLANDDALMIAAFTRVDTHPVESIPHTFGLEILVLEQLRIENKSKIH